MRPLSVASDLGEAIWSACQEAAEAGLDYDQIKVVVNTEVENWVREMRAEALESQGN